MASTNKTPNYDLPQWESTDKPERTDFNQAMSDIDSNLNLVDTTVSSHLAESANKHITESGSNANGRYIKFDDGTMICYGRITKTLNIATAFGALFRNDNDTLIIEYPVPFYTPPALSIVNSGDATLFFANQTNLTVFNAKMYAMRPTSLNTSSLMVDWQATGRWKV